MMNAANDNLDGMGNKEGIDVVESGAADGYTHGGLAMNDGQFTPISKVSDVLNIPRNTRIHAVSVVCQIGRFSESPRYKFFTCFVEDDVHPEVQKNFSFKVWKEHMEISKDVKTGDLIRINQGYKNRNCQRRVSNNYTMRPDDLDIEVHTTSKTTIDVVFSLGAPNIIKNFGLLQLQKTNVKVRGVVSTLPQGDGNGFAFMLGDYDGKALEVEMKTAPDLKVHDTVIIDGDMVKMDMTFILIGHRYEHIDINKMASILPPTHPQIVVVPVPEQPSSYVASLPQANPAASPQANPTATPQANPVAHPQATPAVALKAIPIVAPQANPAATTQANPVAHPQAYPIAAPQFLNVNGPIVRDPHISAGSADAPSTKENEKKSLRNKKI